MIHVLHELCYSIYLLLSLPLTGHKLVPFHISNREQYSWKFQGCFSACCFKNIFKRVLKYNAFSNDVTHCHLKYTTIYHLPRQLFKFPLVTWNLDSLFKEKSCFVKIIKTLSKSLQMLYCVFALYLLRNLACIENAVALHSLIN